MNERKISWLDQWCLYSGVSPDRVSAADRDELETRFSHELRPIPEKRSVQLMRLYSDPFLRLFPTSLRLRFTSLLKKARNPAGKTLIVEAPQWKLLQLHLALQKKYGGSSRLWNGKRAAICLSHDVDNSLGYRFIPEMLRQQSALRLPGTFNFVTSYDYSMDPELLKEISRLGFEVGLHCLTHDIGLAYRRPQTIHKTLRLALERMPVKPQGYRSAALSISPALHDAVSDLGLTYDSTIQVSNPVYHCATWPFPYYLERSRLWEIPLTLQDDVFLRDANIELSVAQATVSRMLDAIVEAGGVFVMILHPHLMARYPTFYQKMLELFSSYHDRAWITTTGNVVNSVINTYANRRHLLQ